MQISDTQLVERLEQRIVELQQENAELKHSLRHVVLNTMDLVRKIERGAAANKAAFDQILGRPIADTNPVDEPPGLVRGRVSSNRLRLVG